MRNPRLHKLLLGAFIVVLPIIVTGVLVRFYLHERILTFTPASGDELEYWHEILSFSQVGFNSGSYSINEVPAPAAFTPFGFHGPLFPMFYGSIAHFAGWYPQSSQFYNMGLIALALLIYLLVVRPGRMALLVLALLIAVFWPMPIYIVTSMQDLPHQAFAVMLAALFYRLISNANANVGSAPRLPALALVCLLFILTISLMRLSWLSTLLPFFFIVIPRRFGLTARLLLSAAATLLFAVPAYLLFDAISAPYPFPLFTSQISNLASDPIGATGVLLEQLGENLSNINSGDFIVHIVQRYQLIGVGAVGVVLIVLYQRQQQRRTTPDDAVSTTTGMWFEGWFQVLHFGMISALMLVLYQVGTWRDYRILAPHLLLALLMLLAFQRLRFVVIFAAINLVLLPSGLAAFRDNARPHYNADDQRIARFGEVVRPYLIYDPAAESVWCNTLLIDQPGDEIVMIPAGIGVANVEYLESADQRLIVLPPKSRYLLLRESTLEEWGSEINVEVLVELDAELGQAYLLRNLDADCESVSTPPSS